MAKYEYWFMPLDMAELVTANSALRLRTTVTQMGADGWELISVTPVQTGQDEYRVATVMSFLGSFRRSIE